MTESTPAIPEKVEIIPAGDALSTTFGRLAPATETLGSEAQSFKKAPYLGFFVEQMKGSKVAELMKDIGEALSPGQPFVKHPENGYRKANHRFALLQEFKFWGDFDFRNGGRVIEAYADGEEPRERCQPSTPRSERLNEAYLIVLIHVPRDEEPFFSISRMTGAQSRFVREMARATTEALRPSFATRLKRIHGPEFAGAVMLPGFPERLRVLGSTISEFKGSSNYLCVDARVEPITPAEYKALGEFLSKDKAIAEMNEMLDIFDQRVDSVKADIERTRTQGGAPVEESTPARVSRPAPEPISEEDIPF